MSIVQQSKLLRISPAEPKDPWLTAADDLFQVGYMLDRGYAWFRSEYDDSPYADLENNFGDFGATRRRPVSERRLQRYSVRLWSTVHVGGDVYGEVAAGFREMARFLMMQAAIAERGPMGDRQPTGNGE